MLDLSFNKIKDIEGLEHLTLLKDLFFVSNKISKIPQLNLVNLTNLELGDNRIREIENLNGLVHLQQLWLGKNKITKLSGLECLVNLRLLSIQVLVLIVRFEFFRVIVLRNWEDWINWFIWKSFILVIMLLSESKG